VHEKPRRPHRRDPEGHRQAILRAARETFTEFGYARATMREIAHRAGVTHGLVARQFTSKERLFLAALPGNRDLEQVAAGDPATLPDRIARGFVERMEADSVHDPLVALIRSAASNEHAASRLLAAMYERSSTIYRTVLTPATAGENASKPASDGETASNPATAGENAGEPPGADDQPGEAGGDDLDDRVALVGAHLIGITFSRYIARTEPLASMPPDRLIRYISGTLHHILFDSPSH
jgi:AcrR family transcriptional regulator